MLIAHRGQTEGDRDDIEIILNPRECHKKSERRGSSLGIKQSSFEIEF